MKTLAEYLAKATHYLYPNTREGGAERQREKFLKYCEANGLDKEFVKLVEEDPEWVKMAESGPLFFFEDAYRGHCTSVNTPSISLLGTEGGMVPVIKLLLRNRNELDRF